MLRNFGRHIRRKALRTRLTRSHLLSPSRLSLPPLTGAAPQPVLPSDEAIPVFIQTDKVSRIVQDLRGSILGEIVATHFEVPLEVSSGTSEKSGKVIPLKGWKK